MSVFTKFFQKHLTIILVYVTKNLFLITLPGWFLQLIFI